MRGGFTRQETLRLTGITSNKLSYLERTGLVIPASRTGHPKHPSVTYTFEQILQIKTIYRLREELSLQEIRKVLDYLERENYKPSLFEMGLLFFNSKLYWVKDENALHKKIIELTGKYRGQIVMQKVDPIGDVFEELRQEAEKHHVWDFNERVKEPT